MLSRLLRRRIQLELTPSNVTDTWMASDEWRTWECPRNVIAGESHYGRALRRLAGKPRDGGYLLPVDVWFIREPGNKYDRNALRAEVKGHHIGYLRREVALQVAGPVDAARCTRFCVAGVVRGGSITAPNIGVHVWLGRRRSPGPALSFADDTWEVAWPPTDTEGLEPCNAEPA